MEKKIKRKTVMMAVGHAHRIWNEYISRTARDMGVPDAYTKIILFLSGHPGANQRQIADFSDVTAAAVNQTVKEMCAAGYLRKETDARDKRHSRLYLTEKGEEKSAALHAAFDRADRVLTEAISRERENELIAYLDRLGDCIREELLSC